MIAAGAGAAARQSIDGHIFGNSSEHFDAVKSVGNDPFLSCKYSSRREKHAQQEMEHLLNVFSDPYMNRHLVFAIVDLFVLAIFPELSDRTVGDMLDERLA